MRKKDSAELLRISVMDELYNTRARQARECRLFYFDAELVLTPGKIAESVRKPTILLPLVGHSYALYNALYKRVKCIYLFFFLINYWY